MASLLAIQPNCRSREGRAMTSISFAVADFTLQTWCKWTRSFAATIFSCSVADLSWMRNCGGKTGRPPPWPRGDLGSRNGILAPMFKRECLGARPSSSDSNSRIPTMQRQVASPTQRSPSEWFIEPTAEPSLTAARNMYNVIVPLRDTFKASHMKADT